MRDFVLFYLNGKPVTVRGEKTRMMLADFLRYEKHLTGTKIVCAEGDCGACSVLRYSPLQLQSGFVAINSCITTVAQMDGSSLVTVEGLADENRLHPIQESMVACHGSQCGFCTPGFVMATAGLVEKKLLQQQAKELNTSDAKISEKEAKNYLTGNLCRCTGYQPIIDAVTSVDISHCQSLEKRYWTQEISSKLEKHIETSLWVQQLSGSSRWIYFAPTTLQEAKDYLHQQADVKIVAAGTDFGVLVNKEKMEPTHWLSLNLVKEMYQLKIGSVQQDSLSQKKSNQGQGVQDAQNKTQQTQATQSKNNQIWVGARVTLAEMRRQIEVAVPEFAKFLDVFASPQIKNAATLVGNIANASPIADTPAFLLIANAVVVVAGKDGDREIPLDKFYLGYRQTAIKPNEMIVAIRFDIPQKNEIIKLRKSSQRKDLDISCVNVGFRLLMSDNKIADLKISMGGVAATPLRLSQTESALRGKAWNEKLLPELISHVQSEINPISDLRGSSSFRRLLVENLLTQFHQEVLSGVCP